MKAAQHVSGETTELQCNVEDKHNGQYCSNYTATE